MKVLETKLNNVLLFKPDIFEDFRGTFTETFNEKEYSNLIKEKIGKNIRFVQDDDCTSIKHVLRGLHGDNETWKLVNCSMGKIYFVVLNYNKKSKEFGKWGAFILSETNKHQILVPPNNGNGHLILSDKATFHYKQSDYYKGPENQFSVKYNDDRFKIWWPIKSPILSQRDES